MLKTLWKRALGLRLVAQHGRALRRFLKARLERALTHLLKAWLKAWWEHALERSPHARWCAWWDVPQSTWHALPLYVLKELLCVLWQRLCRVLM